MPKKDQSAKLAKALSGITGEMKNLGVSADQARMGYAKLEAAMHDYMFVVTMPRELRALLRA